MSYDELQLDTLGDEKTALFAIISDTDKTFNFIVAMIYSQLFNLLCEKADDKYGGHLPIHVICLLDEFAKIGKIPMFEHLISTIRSRDNKPWRDSPKSSLERKSENTTNTASSMTKKILTKRGGCLC